jgi:porin
MGTAFGRGVAAMVASLPLALLAGAQSVLPGDHPYHPFRSPFPSKVAGTTDEFRESYLFGDWLGVRSKLAAHGIKPALLLISDPFGNVIGGQRRGLSNYALLCLDLLLDTGELFALPGGQFHVGFAVNFGTSLSRHYVGNNFPIQLADVAGAQPRLTYLSYTQALFDERVSIRLGRVTVNSVYGEEFMGSEYFKAFTSVGFDLVPLGLFLNAPGAFGYPDTTWGARIRFEPVQQFYTMVGVYNGDPMVKEGNQHGLDFSLRGPPFAIGEIGFRWNYGKQPTGLVRNLKFGAYFNGGTFQVLNSGLAGQQTKNAHDVYGLYVLGDQVLLRWGDPGQTRHLGIFGAFNVVPAQRVNSVPYFFDTGLVAYGLLSGRPKDFAALGVVYGSYSARLQPPEEFQSPAVPSIVMPNFEMTLEWSYGCRVKRGLVLQPGLQYLIHPKGNTAIPNAFAMGINVVINF